MCVFFFRCKEGSCGNQSMNQCHPHLPLNVKTRNEECESLSQQGNQITTKMGGSDILASGGVTQMGPDRFNDRIACRMPLISFLNWCNPIHSLACFARRAAVEERAARRTKHARPGSCILNRSWNVEHSSMHLD